MKLFMNFLNFIENNKILLLELLLILGSNILLFIKNFEFKKIHYFFRLFFNINY